MAVSPVRPGVTARVPGYCGGMPRFAFAPGPLAAPVHLLPNLLPGPLGRPAGRLLAGVDLADVEDAEVTGPYHLLRSLGVHVSLADRGLTFGTSAGPGLCIRFRRPVCRWRRRPGPTAPRGRLPPREVLPTP